MADVMVFDPATVRTDATYDVPAVAPEGINSVWRNGKIVVNANAIV